jgi:hypothetical protein
MKTKFKKCLECQTYAEIHWRRSLCDECFGKLLSEKVKGGEISDFNRR